MDKLECPICGREMVKTLDYEVETEGSFMGFQCDIGHEQIKVDFSPYGFPYVFLGDGCYLAGFDNTSCEKAISRMRREFYESSEYVTRVMEKSYQPDGRHCGMIID